MYCLNFLIGALITNQGASFKYLPKMKTMLTFNANLTGASLAQ